MKVNNPNAILQYYRYYKIHCNKIFNQSDVKITEELFFVTPIRKNIAFIFYNTF